MSSKASDSEAAAKTRSVTLLGVAACAGSAKPHLPRAAARRMRRLFMIVLGGGSTAERPRASCPRATRRGKRPAASETAHAGRRANERPRAFTRSLSEVSRGLLEGQLLHGLRDAELEHGLGRNLDGLAGLRIAAHTRLALHDHELADAGEHEAVARLLRSEGGELFEDRRAGLLLEVELVREVTRDLRLRHHL